MYSTLHFSSRALPFFTPFYNLFYSEGRKIVPCNIVDYLTNIGLAQWIMDDGTLNGGVVLQTDAFTIKEVELLINALKTNFDLISYIRFERKNPVIYIPASQLVLLRSLVIEHMHPSTHYKLGL